MVLKTPEHGHFCQIVLFLYYSAGKFWNKTPMFVTTNGGERPRAAAFGSDPRPFLESSNGLRPLPSAAAFGQFQRRSLFETNKKKTVALASAGIWRKQK